jgi:tetraacyldisaccharide 4'-kinase
MLLSADGQTSPLDTFRDRPVAAFCGIGNPAGFRHTLESIGYRLAAFREFPDHHAYRREDIDGIAAWADASDADAVLCTHKDLVKIGLTRLGRKPLWALVVGLKFLDGEAALVAQLQACMPR